MLELTLATRFEPGTNVKGDVAGANWTFLLPSLELDLAVCLGELPRRDRATLSRLARRLVVVPDSALADGRPLPVADGSADLVVLSGSGGAARLAATSALRDAVLRALKPGGLVYVESGRWRDRLCGHSSAAALAAQFPVQRRWWVTPLVGDNVSTAVPRSERAAAAYFAQHRLTAPSWRHSWCAAWERRLHQRTAPEGRWQRQALLLGSQPLPPTDDPPDYLRRVAGEAGLDLAGYGWALAAKGRYTSRKVLCYLFPPGTDHPQYIAKLTRHASLNARLENEQRALAALAHQFDTGEALAPRGAFFGHHGGLAILGQTIAPGRPWLSASTLSVGCPASESMLALLGELAERTASAAPVGAEEARRAFGTLVERLAELYDLAAAQRRALDQQVESLAAGADALRTVVQHGDPGPWNALLAPNGATLLLDWEAAELAGVPLWDLFYFWRSFTIRSARRQRRGDSLAALARHWRPGSPCAERLARAASDYGGRIGLAGSMVAGLFYLCWVHRALKEATRLPPERRQQGHYIRLLRWALDEQLADKLFPVAAAVRPVAIASDA